MITSIDNGTSRRPSARDKDEDEESESQSKATAPQQCLRSLQRPQCEDVEVPAEEIEVLEHHPNHNSPRPLV